MVGGGWKRAGDVVINFQLWDNGTLGHTGGTRPGWEEKLFSKRCLHFFLYFFTSLSNNHGWRELALHRFRPRVGGWHPRILDVWAAHRGICNFFLLPKTFLNLINRPLNCASIGYLLASYTPHCSLGIWRRSIMTATSCSWMVLSAEDDLLLTLH